MAGVSLNHLKTAYRLRFIREGNKNATDIQGESVLDCAPDCFEGSKLSEEIKEDDIEVCLRSPVLVESGEAGGGQEEKGEEGENSCAEQNTATEKPEEECEFLIEESFDLSSVSWISISQKKQKSQKQRTSASFEGHQEAQQHNKRRKNKRELEKTVMPIPLQEIKTTLCNVGERSSRIKQVMAVENDKSQIVRSFVTSQETRKHMYSKNKYKDLAEIHNRSYSISRKQAKDHIPLLEAEQKLSVQTESVEMTKQSLSWNKLATLTKVQYEKQENTVLALPSKDCTQSKNTDIYSDNSDSMLCFVPVAQQSCYNTPVKKPQLPFKKQSGTQKRKKRSPVGPMGRKNRQLVSKNSLEDDHGEEQLDKKENLDPFKLRIELKRATPQKVKETSLPESQNNVHQEDSCEQHVAKKHSNVSVTPQKNEGFLSHDQPLLPLCSDEMLRREWHPFNTNDSDSDKSADLEKNLHSPVSNSLKHELEYVHNDSSPVFCICNEILSIYKYLSTPSFASGKIILNPLKEKGYQYSHTDTLVFHIIYGKLLLMLYDQSYCLTAGNYFFIPPRNVYNIRNLLNEECVILFTQLKRTS